MNSIKFYDANARRWVRRYEDGVRTRSKTPPPQIASPGASASGLVMHRETLETRSAIASPGGSWIAATSGGAEIIRRADYTPLLTPRIPQQSASHRFPAAQSSISASQPVGFGNLNASLLNEPFTSSEIQPARHQRADENSTSTVDRVYSGADGRQYRRRGDRWQVLNIDSRWTNSQPPPERFLVGVDGCEYKRFHDGSWQVRDGGGRWYDSPYGLPTQAFHAVDGRRYRKFENDKWQSKGASAWVNSRPPPLRFLRGADGCDYKQLNNGLWQRLNSKRRWLDSGAPPVAELTGPLNSASQGVPEGDLVRCFNPIEYRYASQEGTRLAMASDSETGASRRNTFAPFSQPPVLQPSVSTFPVTLADVTYEFHRIDLVSNSNPFPLTTPLNPSGFTPQEPTSSPLSQIELTYDDSGSSRRREELVPDPDPRRRGKFITRNALRLRGYRTDDPRNAGETMTRSALWHRNDLVEDPRPGGGVMTRAALRHYEDRVPDPLRSGKTINRRNLRDREDQVPDPQHPGETTARRNLRQRDDLVEFPEHSGNYITRHAFKQRERRQREKERRLLHGS